MKMKMRRVLLTLIAASAMVRVSAESLPAIQNVGAYESLSLNGEWNYIVDVQEEGYYDYRMNPTRWGFFVNAKPQKPEDLIEYDFDKSLTMQIPSDWNTKDERLFFYEGTVWFKKSFQAVPMTDYRTLLYFGAVNYDCRVWVNGKEAGHHVGGFTPFNYDISDMLREGENVVIVKVDNKRHADAVPTQIFDWWNYGGITRDVCLVKVPKVYMEDYCLQLANTEGRQISFNVKLNKPESNHDVTLSIPELKIKKTIKTTAEGTAAVNIKAKPQLWTPDNPKRYHVEISLDNHAVVDSIGFRTITTRGKQILLNGQPIFLKGISMHEEKPNGGGRANSAADAHTLLTWAKELGCNFVRLAHYPHNEYMVREAERMGIMVWSEIPCYWTIAWTNPATYENAKQQLTDMIRRDHNRANVIIWSIANETPHSAERDNFLSRLAMHARSLDNTRLISMAMEVTGASNYVNRLNDNMNKYVDVVSFNQYRMVPRRERCTEDALGDSIRQTSDCKRIWRWSELWPARREEPALDGGVSGESLHR